MNTIALVTEEKIKAVQIGSQLWMADNLDIETYRNGEPIFHAASQKDWEMARKEKSPAWCYYNNNPELGKIYGKLYNWYAVNDPRGLAPDGWHIPSFNNFKILKKAISKNISSLKNMEDDIFISEFLDIYSNNFDTLLGGYRNYCGCFDGINETSYLWSSTLNDISYATSLQVICFKKLFCLNGSFLNNGFSVRCIKDYLVEE